MERKPPMKPLEYLPQFMISIDFPPRIIDKPGDWLAILEILKYS